MIMKKNRIIQFPMEHQYPTLFILDPHLGHASCLCRVLPQDDEEEFPPPSFQKLKGLMGTALFETFWNKKIYRRCFSYERDNLRNAIDEKNVSL